LTFEVASSRWSHLLRKTLVGKEKAGSHPVYLTSFGWGIASWSFHAPMFHDRSRLPDFQASRLSPVVVFALRDKKYGAAAYTCVL
jgi:hypothetical protein